MLSTHIAIQPQQGTCWGGSCATHVSHAYWYTELSACLALPLLAFALSLMNVLSNTVLLIACPATFQTALLLQQAVAAHLLPC